MIYIQFYVGKKEGIHFYVSHWYTLFISQKEMDFQYQSTVIIWEFQSH